MNRVGDNSHKIQREKLVQVSEGNTRSAKSLEPFGGKIPHDIATGKRV